MPFTTLRSIRRLLANLAVAVALAPAVAPASVYDVGPGQPLAAIADVPWASLAPGDEVRIHWRAAPYREKWVLGRSGTPEAPILVRGVRGPGGARPVIDGDGATTPSPLNFWSEQRGVIKVGGSNTPASTLVSHLVIEGLEVRGGRQAHSFTDDGGATQLYAKNAAAIFVEAAEDLVIRDCVITDSGNGLFVAAANGETRDIRIERNWIHGNGNDASAYEHNTYTAAIGIVYEANRFGPLRPGALGNNLKDRSAGLVVRTNWIEGGNRQLDLVDAEDSSVIVGDPRYGTTTVYGNVLIEPDGAGNSQIVHYGGDSGNESIYRKGTLHFFHNTVVSFRSGNTTLLRLSSNGERADVRNNLLYAAAGGARLAMLDATGLLDLSHNWLRPGWVDSHGTLSGVVSDDSSRVEADDPGFVSLAAQDLTLVASSSARDAGAALHPAVPAAHAVVRQYRVHQSSDPRFQDAAADVGAFEHCAVPCPEPGAGAVVALLTLAVAVGRRRRRAGSGRYPRRSCSSCPSTSTA